ncbi:MAG: helix-turn-helix domain-containing protein [Candidatus Hydrogenedentes bacterium]|nr:helix-turn-helix domain-containing protein [Candidatus Hydrogenedentota bacterium]
MEHVVKEEEATQKAALMTVGEVAELLRVSTRMIHRLRDSGRMPQPIKLGGSVRWRRAELLEWIEDGCPVQRHASRSMRRG